MKLVEALTKPVSYGYPDVAMYFYGVARKEWYGSTGPYNVQFDPLPQIQERVTGELFAAFRQLLPPTDEAYQRADISFYVSIVEQVIGGESIVADLLDSGSREVKRYGLGILKRVNQSRIILLPPGFTSQLIGKLTPISAGDIGKDLLRDLNPQRRFRLVEELGYWEAAA